MADRTNAERQRRYIARLKEQAAKASVSNAGLKDEHPKIEFPEYQQSTRWSNDVTARQITDWLKKEMVAGRISAQSLDMIGRSAQHLAEQNWRGIGKPFIKKTPTAKAPPPTDDERVLKLQKQLKELKRKYANMEGWSGLTDLPVKAGMSFATHNAIMKALHPDSSSDDPAAVRDAACKAFNEWKAAVKRRSSAS